MITREAFTRRLRARADELEPLEAFYRAAYAQYGSYPKAAAAIGCDHTTVMYYVKGHEYRAKKRAKGRRRQQLRKMQNGY